MAIFFQYHKGRRRYGLEQGKDGKIYQKMF